MYGNERKRGLVVVKVGLIVAISVIMSIPPFGTFKIPIFYVDVTLAHLPTIIMSILEGPLVGAVCGLFLGIISMIRCITEPVGLNVFIANPMVSVLPRILIGVSAGLLYKGFTRIIKSRPLKKEAAILDAAAIGVSAAIGSIVNTVGVLGMLYIISLKDLAAMLADYGVAQAAGAFLLGIATTGGVGEMIIVAVLTAVIVKALRRAGYKKS